LNSSSRIFLIIGAIAGGLAVITGAFGAHGLRAVIDPSKLSAWQTAVDYHFYHALGLCAVAFAAERMPGSRLIRAAGWLMLAGIVLFSGSLYVLSLSGIGKLGMITPFGGLAFIAGWLSLAAGLARKPA
jgi:uncharacterized membrane protein YgdD (TMEM256/DUF423 family)